MILCLTIIIGGKVCVERCLKFKTRHHACGLAILEDKGHRHVYSEAKLSE